MNHPPKITIILTTFNRAHLIGETLDSIIAQTYQNWECIIIDDNSSDETKDVVEKTIKTDPRFIYIVKPKDKPQGLPTSRNIGIKKTIGDYIVFFDDDDIAHQQLLNNCIETFNNFSDTDFVHYQKQSFQDTFDYSQLNTSINIIAENLTSNLYEDVITGKLALASCTVMWKTKLLKNNLFAESLMYAEEWECYSRILIKNNLKGMMINIPLYFNRKHPNSNTAEFWSNNAMRVNSKLEACKMIIQTLVKHQKLTNKLAHFFIQQSYQLKDKSIVTLILSQKWKYNFLYYIFPIKHTLYKLFKN